MRLMSRVRLIAGMLCLAGWRVTAEAAQVCDDSGLFTLQNLASCTDSDSFALDNLACTDSDVFALDNRAVAPSEPDKTRFISFSVSITREVAIRVKLTSLHHVEPPYTGGASVPFTALEGQVRWVGPPMQYVESVSSGVQFHASQLQCAPYYQDWSTVALLHVTGAEIVPSSIYDVEVLAALCQGNEPNCTAVSSPLQIKTTRWGDVETPYNPPVSDTQPDTSDISALVNKFKSALGAPIKARALLAGDSSGAIDISPDFNFTHISLCADAFKGLPYPYKPGKCTGDAAKACISDSDCSNAPNPTTGPCILCP